MTRSALVISKPVTATGEIKVLERDQVFERLLCIYFVYTEPHARTCQKLDNIAPIFLLLHAISAAAL
jgi:hypothetical protein